MVLCYNEVNGVPYANITIAPHTTTTAHTHTHVFTVHNTTGIEQNKLVARHMQTTLYERGTARDVILSNTETVQHTHMYMHTLWPHGVFSVTCTLLNRARVCVCARERVSYTMYV